MPRLTSIPAPQNAALCLALSFSFFGLGALAESPAAAVEPIVFNDDGGWCWFEEPRVLVENGQLIIGSVANGRFEPERRGDIEVTIHHLQSGKIARRELHDRLQADDHDSPVFLRRPDGRFLAVYAKHGPENHFYYRLSQPDDPTRWGSERQYAPSPTTRLTYQNLFQLRNETNRIYNFFRGLDNSWKPSYVFSDDGGETWNKGHVVIHSPAARPYVRYASDGRGTIHLFYTEGHPRDFDNSVYHLFYRNGKLHRSDGTTIAGIEEGISDPAEGTRIFQGDADHVAWCSDIELDGEGHPWVAYSVQVGSAGLPPRQGGEDLRYRYARWTGSRWEDHPLAFAGSRLYAGEDDYSGLVALDPHNPDVLYLSTNADPAIGHPLVSASDHQRHWEIFKGVTADRGATWTWTPVTRDSTFDNLRPIVPRSDRFDVLLWLRGRYHAYTRYELEVVGTIRPRPSHSAPGAGLSFPSVPAH